MHEKGGGVAISFNDSLQNKKMSHGNCASFEYVSFQLNSFSEVISISKYLQAT